MGENLFVTHVDVVFSNKILKNVGSLLLFVTVCCIAYEYIYVINKILF